MEDGKHELMVTDANRIVQPQSLYFKEHHSTWSNKLEPAAPPPLKYFVVNFDHG